MQVLRDNPDVVDARARAHRRRRRSRALTPRLTFDPDDDVAAPFIATGARPRVAILREQGVNGQVEMAAAFDRAGFDAYDVHMSDLAAGRRSLADFKGIVACGGFSYGDVLGAGEGWAKSILLRPGGARRFRHVLRTPRHVRARRVQRLPDDGAACARSIPGAGALAALRPQRSPSSSRRGFVLVEIAPSPSLFFAGMAGSRIPVATAHGEGYAEFRDAAALASAQPLVALRFVDHRGVATDAYPYNVNGSPQGITGLTTADGRFTILMPHPERVHRSAQMSWHPDGWGDASPWMRMFRNARAWLG